MANTMKALQTVTVGAGGAASISFTDIPQTYTDLVLKLSLRDGTSAQSANANIILNSNGSTVYSSRRLYGTGSGVASDSFSNLSSMPGTWVNSATATSSTFANIEFYIPNYAGSNNKSVSIDSVTENNATAAFSGLTAGLFASSSPITSLGISTGSNFVQYSTATLYGVFNQDVSVAPAAPTIGTASDGGTGTSASVAFTGVSGAASYTATSSPGGLTATGTASPITVTGLTEGTAYTFTVKANNPIGSSAPSAASNSVTPEVPGAFESIATVTSTGSQYELTFSSIPQTYKHLQIRGVATDGNASTLRLRINGSTSTSDYTQHLIDGNGSTVSAGGLSSGTVNSMAVVSMNDQTNTWAGTIIDILDYTNTSKYKTVAIFAGRDRNSSSGQINLRSGLFLNTSGITSITFVSPGLLTSGSTFALYGVK